MIERIPFTHPEQIKEFDDSEIIEGYMDGRNNEPCGDNRSPAYWHGWRNGLVDGKHWEGDNAQKQFVHNWVETTRQKDE